MSQIVKEELILWQSSLSSPISTFNAVKIGGIQGLCYLLVGKKLDTSHSFGKRCQMLTHPDQEPCQRGAVDLAAYLWEHKAANLCFKMG